MTVKMESDSGVPAVKEAVCGQCDYKYQTLEEIMFHVKNTAGHESKCVDCNKSFTEMKWFRQHIRRVHIESGEVICSECGKKSVNQNQNYQHWHFVHKKQEDLFCNLCGKGWQNLSKLKKHTRKCLRRDPAVVEIERKRNQVENPKCAEQVFTWPRNYFIEFQKLMSLKNNNNSIKSSSGTENVMKREKYASHTSEYVQEEMSKQGMLDEKKLMPISSPNKRSLEADVTEEDVSKKMKSIDANVSLCWKVESQDKSRDKMSCKEDEGTWETGVAEISEEVNKKTKKKFEEDERKETCQYNVTDVEKGDFRKELDQNNRKDEGVDKKEPGHFVADVGKVDDRKDLDQNNSKEVGKVGESKENSSEVQELLERNLVKDIDREEVLIERKNEDQNEEEVFGKENEILRQDIDYDLENEETWIADEEELLEKESEFVKTNEKVDKTMEDKDGKEIGNILKALLTKDGSERNCDIDRIGGAEDVGKESSDTDNEIKPENIKLEADNPNTGGEEGESKPCIECSTTFKTLNMKNLNDFRTHMILKHSHISTSEQDTKHEEMEDSDYKPFSKMEPDDEFNLPIQSLVKVEQSEEKEAKKACPHCGKVINSGRLKRHIQQVHEKVQFCRKCKQYFPNFAQHTKEFHPKAEPTVDELTCKQCFTTVKNLKSLKRHMREQHDDSFKVICPICPGNKLVYRTHIKQAHKEEPAMCDICSAQFMNNTKLRKHKRRVHGEKIGLPCQFCKQIYDNKDKLSQHIHAVHKEEPSICDICSAIFRNRHSLNGHKRKVHAEKEAAPCPDCNQVYETKYKLYQHIYAVHNLQESPCHVCGKTYKNPKLLQAHKKVMHPDVYVSSRPSENVKQEQNTAVGDDNAMKM